ncbi:peptidoglycan editing factor PgeF [Rhodoferax sp.]|uniref:peptidoglycan editing factor PgeF n=1 Tax=Rhodoferax sp. TaxID=50421 RepID=UPI0025DA5D09|nr:peptidoglycan editing factor PgeF [Rhodoferax sp.]
MTDWIVPDWPAPAQVRAVFTTRAGGVSAAPYDALNLGDHVGDVLADVQANRARLADAIAAQPVFLQQVHGRVVAHLTGPSQAPVVADASFTTQPGIACTAMVADCLPVLFTDTRGTVVAAAHAGWRGLLGTDGQGVLESIYKEITVQAHVASAQAATEIIAWLGPCIGPTAFEVGPEVPAAFIAQQPEAAALFVRHGPDKWLANLPGLARLRLQALGLQGIYGNDGSLDWCTVNHPSRFFSYRRSGVCGRMAACIWLQA